MKRILIVIAASAFLAGLAFAKDIAYTALVPKTAKSMALGGVFTSVPTAEFSFFGNPSSFAAKRATLIITSVDAWAYLVPTSKNLSSFGAAVSDTDKLMSTAFALMGENGGTGAGVGVGLGYAGRGLGLGLFATSDEYAEGSSPASATLHSQTEITGVVGLSFPLQLWGLRLALGGDLRPFYRISVDTALADILEAMDADGDPTEAIDGHAFFGVAMDLGASLELGSLTFGLSIRDISPTYVMSSASVKVILDSLSGAGEMPKPADNADSAVFTPNITAGLSWAPRFLPGLIDPVVYFELQDPVSIIKDKGSVWNLLHTGAEVKLLSLVTLRGGLNRGWLSAGAGFKLLFIDMNVAFFTEELGPLPGDHPRSGLSIQAAFRF